MDAAQRNALVLKYQPLARKEAYKSAKRWPSLGMSLEEWQSYMNEGLVVAIDNYREGSGAKLGGYLIWRLKWWAMGAAEHNGLGKRSHKGREQLRNVIGYGTYDLDLWSAPDVLEDEVFSRVDLEKLSAGLSLPERVLLNDMCNGKSVRFIAKRLGCSKEWARLLRINLTNKLRDHAAYHVSDDGVVA